MAGGTPSWGVLAVASLASLACEANDKPLSWTVRFACANHGTESDRVELRVARGTCPAGEEVVYETTVSRASPAPSKAPGELAAGAYALSAVAYSPEDTIIAQGCSNTRLPTEKPIDLFLNGSGSSPCIPREQRSGDGGTVDAGTKIPADWFLEGKMPLALGCVASAAAGDGIHVLGGSLDFEGTLRSQTHYLYDVGADRWRTLAAKVPDTDTWCAQAHVYAGKLYLTGGWPDGDYRFRVYDLVKGAWTTLPDLPARFRYGYASAVSDKSLFLFGGRDQAAAQGKGFKYSFVSGTWSPVAPIPSNAGFGALASAVWRGRIYVISGGASNGDTILQIYDIAKDAWSNGPSVAGKYEGAAAAALGGRIYVFGGASSAYNFPELPERSVWVYDTAEGTWAQGTPMATGRLLPSATPVGDAIYVFGGFHFSRMGIASFAAYRP